MKEYVLAIDEGTTGVRAIVFDKETNIVSQSYAEIPQMHPNPGWVEQDAELIWSKCKQVIEECLTKENINPKEIIAMGIATQRSTNLLWDKSSGKPVYNAITWEDIRSAPLCSLMDKKLKMRLIRSVGYLARIFSKLFKGIKRNKFSQMLITASTLRFNPASALAHAKWILENDKDTKEKGKKGELLHGTIDTWLIWKLTEGKVHATDFSNASASGMFDTFNLCWNKLFLNLFDVPAQILPEVRESSGDFGTTNLLGSVIPIRAAIADQQSALFGEGCFSPGDAKCTHGTGSFIDMNVGHTPKSSLYKLLPLIAWKIDGEVTYMLEGFIASTGSAIKWLKEGLELIKDPLETEQVAMNTTDTCGVYVVPAFSGLTAPYWDAYARALIIGLTRGTNKAHIIRALLEGIVYRCKDVLLAMEEDADLKITSIKADGGASRNNFLLQFMANMLNVTIERPKILEATSIGAAYLAGLAVKYWNSKEDILKSRKIDRSFTPDMQADKALKMYEEWGKAVKRSFKWAI